MSRRRPTAAEIAAAFRTVAGRDGSLVEIGARAGRTWMQYRDALQLLVDWCGGKNLTMPAPTEAVRDWLVEMASVRGRAVATVSAYHAAVSVAYALRGWPLDRQVLAEAKRSIRRRYARPPRRARPIGKAQLQELLATLIPTRPADARDGALMALGWAKMLREAEITSLDWMRHGDGMGYLRVNAEGATIVLLRSKTSQAGAWRTFIARAVMPEAVEALERWAKIAKLKPAEPVFRPVHGRNIGDRRLNPEAVCAILQRRVVRSALAAGISESEARELARDITGHALRAGGITAQHEAGVDLATIQRTSRHKRLDTLLGYIRPAQEMRDDGLAKTWRSDGRTPPPQP